MNRPLALIIAAIFTLLAGCSKSPLHDPMEDMGDAFKAIKEAEDLSTVSAQIDAFIEAAKLAQAQTVPEEVKESFDKGMGRTVELAAQLKLAVESGNTELAKATIKKMGQTSKEYHDKFEVE